MSMKDELKDIINSTFDLPPMPLVANRIVSLTSDPNTDAKILERAILADQALTANILRIANSSFYGCIRSINSIASAIVLIGFKGIKSLVVAASIKSFYRRVDLTENMLWEHSIGAAVTAHFLSKKLHCYTEEAFVGGLIHDIGKSILNNQKNEIFAKIMQTSYNNGLPFVEIEKELLGFTHAELGGVIIRKWNLSTALEKAVMYHHNLQCIDSLDPDIQKFVALLDLTNKICLYLGIGYRQPNEEIDFKELKSVQILRAGELDFSHLIKEIKTEYEAEKENF